MAKKKEEKFLDIILNQRKKKTQEKFKGTFLEYLEKVNSDPSLAMLAHKRLYGSIVSHGARTMDDSNSRKHKLFSGDNVKIFDYFDEHFFGMERVIEQLMNFLRSASLRGEESRQVLLLMGPVGAGKSALTEHIKSALDGLTYYHLEGDPQRGQPLQLIPRNLREKFEDILGTPIEGDISPIVRHVLLEEHDGKYENYSWQQ